MKVWELSEAKLTLLCRCPAFSCRSPAAFAAPAPGNSQTPNSGSGESEGHRTQPKALDKQPGAARAPEGSVTRSIFSRRVSHIIVIRLYGLLEV